MQILIKIALSIAIILTATGVAKRFPSAAGLIGVMPLTGALVLVWVLVWVYVENQGNPQVMQSFSRGAFWGLLPTLLFFLVAFLCFRKECSLTVVLLASFAAWGAGALLHQWLLK